jgi:hypothetical protein
MRTGPSGFRDHEHHEGGRGRVFACLCVFGVCMCTEPSARKSPSERICVAGTGTLFLAWRRLSHPRSFANVKFLIFLQTVAALFPLLPEEGHLFERRKRRASDAAYGGETVAHSCASQEVRCGTYRGWIRAQLMERRFSQVRRLCGQDPCQPATDGNRHQREALHGTAPHRHLAHRNPYPLSLASPSKKKFSNQEPF